MHLNIKYQNRDGIAEEHWNYTVASAKETASRWINEGLADWVEIRDANDQLLAHLPRLVHGA